jgi:hypothetical protein
LQWEPIGQRRIPERRLSYSQLIAELRGGHLTEATLEGGRVAGGLGSGARFFADVPDDVTRGRLLAALEAQQARQPSLLFDVRPPVVNERLQSVFVSVLIPLGAIVLLWGLFWRQAQSSQPLLHGSGCVAPRAGSAH